MIIDMCDMCNCTGCGACSEACPLRCIAMEEDESGAMYPHVDIDKCIRCNKCILACPNNSSQEFNYPMRCYVAWNDDKEKRQKCASGGIASALGEFIIKVKHGVVVGVAYSRDFMPVLTIGENIDEIDKFKGSKYVQATIDDGLFAHVKLLLDSGRFVLFVATPCQIAGIKSFLGVHYENLVTVDLICHGVAPTCYFIEELRDIIMRKGIDASKIVDVRFRGNDLQEIKSTIWDRMCGRNRSNNFTMTIWSKGNEHHDVKRVFCESPDENCYFAGFLEGITLRENCYRCKYAKPERISDITIGDFIGIGSLAPFTGPGNVSSVMINTERGNKFFMQTLMALKELKCEERSYGERLSYKPSLIYPFPRNALRDKFLEVYRKSGWRKAARIVIGKNLRKKRAKGIICALARRFLRLTRT